MIGESFPGLRPGERGGASDSKGGVRAGDTWDCQPAQVTAGRVDPGLYLKSSQKPMQGVSPFYNMMLLC